MAKQAACDKIFYFVQDIMNLTGYSKSKAYKVIAQLNKELEAAGYITFDGRISRTYFHKRTGIDISEAQPTVKPHTRRTTAGTQQQRRINSNV